MKKIMFSDKYGLTKAVLEGRKTQTRRIVKDKKLDFAISHFGIEDTKNISLIEEQSGIDGSLVWGIKVRAIPGYVDCISPKYKIGEVVSVAQSYNEIVKEFPHYATKLVGEDITGNEPGCTNKMFVRDGLMPHHIKITGIRAERLQDISDEDCFKEGIEYNDFICQYSTNATLDWYESPKKAFVNLIDKTSGKGTWQRNPFVYVYEFKLVD